MSFKRGADFRRSRLVSFVQNEAKFDPLQNLIVGLKGFLLELVFSYPDKMNPSNSVLFSETIRGCDIRTTWNKMNDNNFDGAVMKSIDSQIVLELGIFISTNLISDCLRETFLEYCSQITSSNLLSQWNNGNVLI